jgi:hypothetical protein
MLFNGFKSKKALKDRIADTARPPLRARSYFEETSMFGNELLDNGTFCVCMDHPKRSKFANISVENGLITRVR